MSIWAIGSTAPARWIIRSASSRRNISARRAGNARADPAQAASRPEHRLTQPSTDHNRGLLLAATGGLALTVDIPLIRLAGGDTWSILLVRSAVTFVAVLTIWILLRAARRNPPPLIPGRDGFAVAACYASATLTFMLAVFNTSTANLVFILAFNSMFAAILSWLFIGERPRGPTLAAMAIMLLGVAVIVGDGIGHGHLFGDLMAAASAFAIACAITLSRRSGKDMGFTPLVAVLAPMAVAAILVGQNGFRIDAPWWIVFNGAVIMPVSFFCLANAPKYIPGPEVAMFYLLETVLAPVWVWMIFAEVPTTATLAGGALLVATLVAHSLWQLNKNRKRRAALAVRHPA
ncbi:MAG: DMT family transporter [Rhizobiaceae bacterium]|nr:DMT family transporter [Rhizobiaceae bacterium]MCV0405325.1 DMT family transporter [Rhizobiaceae bacterium]